MLGLAERTEHRRNDVVAMEHVQRALRRDDALEIAALVDDRCHALGDAVRHAERIDAHREDGIFVVDILHDLHAIGGVEAVEVEGDELVDQIVTVQRADEVLLGRHEQRLRDLVAVLFGGMRAERHNF